MPVTVAQLVSFPGLGLRLLTGQDVAGSEIRWAAVSELTNPAPYLEGAELLLSTGMHLPEKGGALNAYLEELRAAGVAAFGLGTGPALTHSAPPEALVQACREQGLPLIEVPNGTPFIAVTRALAERLAAEQRDELESALKAQRKMVDAGHAAEPVAAVIRHLASAFGGWAAAFDSRRRVVASAGPNALAKAAQLDPDLSRLAARTLHASARVDIDGDSVVVQPVGSGGRTVGFVAAGTATAFGPARRSLVAVAAAVLSSGPAPRNERVRATSSKVILRLLLAGHSGDAVEVAEAAGIALPIEPVQVLAITPSSDVLDVAAAIDSWPGSDSWRADDARQDADPVIGIIAELDGRLIALVEAGDLSQVQTWATAAGLTCVGVSVQGSMTDIPELARTAERALSAAQMAGRPWQEATELGTQRVLDALPKDLLSDHARALFAPLASYGGDDLVITLRVWLEHSGHWDATAAELGIHRNTLRYRMRRVEELTGRDLTSMPDRVDLWLALQALDR